MGSLFLAPHDQEFTSTERDGRDTFLPEITHAGFRLVKQAAKSEGSSVMQPIEPGAYYLFQR